MNTDCPKVFLFVLGLLTVFSCTPTKESIYKAIDSQDKARLKRIMEVYPFICNENEIALNPNFQDGRYYPNPLEYAVIHSQGFYKPKKSSSPEFIAFMLEDGHIAVSVQQQAFRQALNHELYSLCDVFLKNGFDLNEPYTSLYGEEFLTEKYMYGDSEVPRLEYLLANGANPNPDPEVDLIAQSLANSHTETYPVLLKAGARIKQIPNTPNALYYCTVFELIEDAEFFLKQGIDPNVPIAFDNSTPAMNAESLEFLMLLADYGADLTHINDEGESVFYWFLINLYKYRLPSDEAYSIFYNRVAESYGSIRNAVRSLDGVDSYSSELRKKGVVLSFPSILEEEEYEEACRILIGLYDEVDKSLALFQSLNVSMDLRSMETEYLQDYQPPFSHLLTSYGVQF